MQHSLVTVDDVAAARRRIDGMVHLTPMVTAGSIGAGLEVELSVKAELLQRTGSFKIRGVLNTLAQLPDEVAGVVSMSAGNHAAALACGARATGRHAVVVMPAHASPGKVDATRRYGGEVVLTERPLVEVMDELRHERGLQVVHPFDDPRIVAGAGTVGLEIVQQTAGAVDVVVVPVGGGGLISGVAAAVRGLVPNVRVVGVEPTSADGMSQALRAGRPVPLDRPRSVADGLAAPFAGDVTLAHVQALVDSVVRVEDAAIEAAARVIVERTKLAVEPAAAAGLAGLMTGAVEVEPGSRVVIVLSGGNVDASVLARIITGGQPPASD